MPGAAACAVAGTLAARGGGFDATTWGWGALSFLWLAAATLVVHPNARLGRLELALAGALAAVLGWTALSVLWTESVTSTVLEVERTLVYPTAVLALCLAARRSSAPGLLGGTLVAVSAVAAWFLGSRLFPAQLGPADPNLNGSLYPPLGYANALGVLAALGIPIALGLAAAPGRARGPAAASLALLLPALYLSSSRGSDVALAAGLAVQVAADPRRVRLLGTALAALPAPLLAAWLVPHVGGVAGAASLCGLGALAAGLVVRLPPPGRRGRRTLAAVALAAGLAAVTLGARSHLSPAGNERAHYWPVALAEFEAHPWLGTGAGTYEIAWLRRRAVATDTRDAHSLYLEALGELGAVGLLLVVVAFAVPVAAAVRVRGQPLVPAALGAWAVYVVHAGVDFDWELTAVTVAALAVGSALVVSARAEQEPRALAPVTRPAALAALVGLGAFAVLALAGNGALAAAADAVAGSDFTGAERQARRAGRLAPWSSEPPQRLGEALLAAGDRADARESFGEALAKDPLNHDLWVDLARASRGRERRRAVREANRLDPLAPVGRAG